MNSIKRYTLIAIGSVSVALGVLGIFLPLLPTTPFLLLAGACFLRSSDRLYNWLINHKVLGFYIKSWKKGQGIPLQAKIISIAFIWVTMAVSAYFLPFPYLKWMFLPPTIVFTWFILKQKTLRKK